MPVTPMALSERTVTQAMSTSPDATARVRASSVDPPASPDGRPVLLHVDGDRALRQLVEPVEERLLRLRDVAEGRDRQAVDADDLLLLADARGQEQGEDAGRGDTGQAE